MIKNDIALAIEKKTEFNRAKSLSIVEAVLESLKAALANKEKVEIRGFGSFKVVAKKTGFGRDIRRQKQIRIEKGQRIKFRPGQELKTLLSKTKSADLKTGSNLTFFNFLAAFSRSSGRDLCLAAENY